MIIFIKRVWTNGLNSFFCFLLKATIKERSVKTERSFKKKRKKLNKTVVVLSIFVYEF